ncbi:PREDICTED: fibrinogen alpha-1 chain-like [Myotis brandtii]|uniref:fibrinogen alpha-1 chain-like n=1 Tax=Myotis brandtii TaxID=109478 RepID=UPI000703E092|nr:PREDICTED: fibrinogen alpha-1 chain-like [Myotis brandtii]
MLSFFDFALFQQPGALPWGALEGQLRNADLLRAPGQPSRPREEQPLCTQLPGQRRRPQNGPANLGRLQSYQHRKVQDSRSGAAEVERNRQTGSGPADRVRSDRQGQVRQTGSGPDRRGSGRTDGVRAGQTGSGRTDRVRAGQTGSGRTDRVRLDRRGQGRTDGVRSDSQGQGWTDRVRAGQTGSGLDRQGQVGQSGSGSAEENRRPAPVGRGTGGQLLSFPHSRPVSDSAWVGTGAGKRRSPRAETGKRGRKPEPEDREVTCSRTAANTCTGSPGPWLGGRRETCSRREGGKGSPKPGEEKEWGWGTGPWVGRLGPGSGNNGTGDTKP